MKMKEKERPKSPNTCGIKKADQTSPKTIEVKGHGTWEIVDLSQFEKKSRPHPAG